jgi:hypothetical protein
LDSFRTYQAAEQEAANDKQKKPWYDEDVLEHVVNDMALEIFPTKYSYCRQVFYMKYHIFMGDGTTVKLFEKRVNWLNQCLKYFPMINLTDGQLKTCECLGVDDLCDIYYTLAIKKEWTSKIIESNAD